MSLDELPDKATAKVCVDRINSKLVNYQEYVAELGSLPHNTRTTRMFFNISSEKFEDAKRAAEPVISRSESNTPRLGRK